MSKKLFHRLIEIPFGEVIHISRNEGKYLFVGLRNRRKKQGVCDLYSSEQYQSRELEYQGN